MLPTDVPVPEREVTASKAMLYTNVYSGPSQTLEFSEFNMQLNLVKNVAEVASKDIGDLRGDIDKIKQKLKASPGDQQTAAEGPKTLGSGFDDGAVNAAQEARLKEIQCAPQLPLLVALQALSVVNCWCCMRGDAMHAYFTLAAVRVSDAY